MASQRLPPSMVWTGRRARVRLADSFPSPVPLLLLTPRRLRCRTAEGMAGGAVHNAPAAPRANRLVLRQKSARAHPHTSRELTRRNCRPAHTSLVVGRHSKWIVIDHRVSHVRCLGRGLVRLLDARAVVCAYALMPSAFLRVDAVVSHNGAFRAPAVTSDFVPGAVLAIGVTGTLLLASSTSGVAEVRRDVKWRCRIDSCAFVLRVASAIARAGVFAAHIPTAAISTRQTWKVLLRCGRWSWYGHASARFSSRHRWTLGAVWVAILSSNVRRTSVHTLMRCWWWLCPSLPITLIVERSNAPTVRFGAI